MGKVQADILLTLGVDERSYNEIDENIRKNLEEMVKEVTNAEKAITTNYSKMFANVIQQLLNSMKGAGDKLGEVAEEVVGKYRYLQQINKDFGVGGKAFEFFNTKDLENVLKNYDKIIAKKKEIAELDTAASKESYKKTKIQETMMSIGDIKEKYKLKDGTAEIKKELKELKGYEKSKMSDDAMNEYASLVDMYKQINKIQTTIGTDKDIKKKQALYTLGNEINGIVNEFGFLKKYTKDNEIESSVEKMAKNIDNSVSQLIRNNIQQENDRLQALEKSAKQTALRIYEARKKGFSGEFKDYDVDLENVTGLLEKFAVDIETAKEKISELNTSTHNRPFKGMEEEYQDLIGYVQRYIDLGGDLNDLNLSGTATKLFNDDKEATLKQIKEQVQQFKNIKNVVFGAVGGGDTGDSTGEGGGSGSETGGNGIGNGTEGTENGTNGIGGLTEEQLQGLIDKLEEIKKAINDVKESVDGISRDESLNKITETFNEINSSFTSLKTSLEDGGTFTTAVNGFSDAIEKVSTALEKIDNSDQQIENLKGRIEELSSALDELKNAESNTNVVEEISDSGQEVIKQVTEQVANEIDHFERLIKFAQEYVELTEKMKKGNPNFLSSKSYHNFYEWPNAGFSGSDIRGNGSDRAASKASVKHALQEYLDISSGDLSSKQGIQYSFDKLSAYVYALKDADEAQKIFGKKNAELFNKVQDNIKNSIEASKAKNEINYGVKDWLSEEVKEVFNITNMTSGEFDELTKSLISDGFNGLINKVRELFGVEIPNAIGQTTNAFQEIQQQVKETTNIISSSESQISTGTTAKDFYEKYGTPSQALDAGSFASIREVLDELGGRFKQIDETAEDFSERKLNVEFLKDLISQLELSENQLIVIKQLFTDIETILPGGEFAYLTDAIQNARVIDGELEKIKSIVDGTYIVTEDDVNNAKNLLQIATEYHNKRSNETPVSTKQAEQFVEQVAKQLPEQEVPTEIKVKPVLDPQEFADEITEQLTGHNAQIGIEPKNDNAEEFVQKVTTLLSGHESEINVTPNYSPTSDNNVNESLGNLDEEKEKIESLNDAIDDVTRKVGLKTAAFVNEQGQVDKTVNIEKQKLSDLKDSVSDVTTAIEGKTSAFEQEVNIVEDAVNQEHEYLKTLVDDLDAIKEKAKIELEIKNKIKENKEKQKESGSPNKPKGGKQGYDQDFAIERTEAIEGKISELVNKYNEQGIMASVRRAYNDHEDLIGAFVKTSDIVTDGTDNIIKELEEFSISYKKKIDEEGNPYGELSVSGSADTKYKNEKEELFKDLAKLEKEEKKKAEKNRQIEERAARESAENQLKFEKSLIEEQAKYEEELENAKIKSRQDYMNWWVQSLDEQNVQEEKAARESIKLEYELEEAKRQSILEEEKSKGKQQQEEYNKQIKQAEEQANYEKKLKEDQAKYERQLEEQRIKSRQDYMNWWENEEHNKQKNLIEQQLNDQKGAYERQLKLEKDLLSVDPEKNGGKYVEIANQIADQKNIIKEKGEYLKQLDSEYDHQKRLNELQEQYADKSKDIDIKRAGMLDDVKNQVKKEQDKAAQKQKDEQYKARKAEINKLLQEQKQAYVEQLNLEKQILQTNPSEDSTLYSKQISQLKEQEKIVEEKGKLLKQLDEEYDHEKRIGELQEENRKKLNEIDRIRANIVDKSKKEVESRKDKEIEMTKLQLEAEEDNRKFDEQRKKEIVGNSLKAFQRQIDSADKATRKTEEYENKLNEIKDKYEELKRYKDFTIFTEDDQKNIDNINEELNKMFKELSDIDKAGNATKAASIAAQISSYLEMNTKLNNTKQGRIFINQLEELQATLKKVGLTDVDIQEVVQTFNNLKVSINEVNLAGKSFFDAVKDKAFYKAAEYVARYFSFEDWIRYARTAITTIRQLDTALVDLRKTTTMSSSELDKFYKSSNNVAKQMGVTTEEIINQASAWSRLGYSSADAATKMAEISSKFASISPGMTTEQAQSGLVSIMKAWDIDVNQAEREILDNINILGNRFAETNLDIVEGMQRSAAALSAVGTSYKDAFALFTGGQEIVQNSEVMGRALRSISLRIRGFSEDSSDDLMEVDEELKNISGDLVDLTKTAQHSEGVSIFKPGSTTEYKSLVEYLGDISEIWDEMTEVQQNAFLNKAFAKTQAQAGAALIKNYDAIKKALEEMEGAAGSADREMDIIRDKKYCPYVQKCA